MVLHVDRGDKMDQRALLRRLADLQYTRNDMEFARATFRVRGDVIDIFPAESDLEAIRIELFDDEVETISAFDPLTGEVIRKLPRYTLYPKSHYVTPREKLLEAVELIKVELKERLEYLRTNNKLVEAQRLEQRHAVRPGDDRRAGLLQRHRKLLALSVRARVRGAAADLV